MINKKKCTSMACYKFILLINFVIFSGACIALDIPAPVGAKAVGDNKAIEERKIKAETEAKAKVANEAKLKAEADAKAKLEAEAKAKAANEAKSKAEADSRIRAQAQAEAKAKAANEANLKAEADAKTKLEAKVKAKAAYEAKLKAELDAKTKLEADSKVKAANEAKSKAEAEADSRIRAEAKAKAANDVHLKAEAEARTRVQTDSKVRVEAQSKSTVTDEKVRRSDTANETIFYDGRWQGTMVCGPNLNNNRPSYSFKKEFKIVDGSFKDQVISKNQLGTATEDWNGRLSINRINILVSGRRDNDDSWEIHFSGPAITSTKFELKGALFDSKQVKVRDCEISLFKL